MPKKKDKTSAKKDKYAKFKKDKPSRLDISAPELSPEQQKQKQLDEEKINSYLRYAKNRPSLSLREKKAKSRR